MTVFSSSAWQAPLPAMLEVRPDCPGGPIRKLIVSQLASSLRAGDYKSHTSGPGDVRCGEIPGSRPDAPKGITAFGVAVVQSALTPSGLTHTPQDAEPHNKNGMPRTDLHIKVVIEHDEDERLDKLAAEICRAIERVYGVRSATVSNTVTHDQG
jgi:hypothetical protein